MPSARTKGAAGDARMLAEERKDEAALSADTPAGMVRLAAASFRMGSSEEELHAVRACIELFATDTRFLGTTLHDSGFIEVGASFEISRVTLEGGKRYDNVLRIGVSGIIARGNNGLTLNTGYMF